MRKLVFGSFAILFLADAARSQVTRRVSLDSSGAQGNDKTFEGRISGGGRYVAFSSEASNLVPGDTNGRDVFVRDLRSGATERVSVSSTGAQADGHSLDPSLSRDGRYVAFCSQASNLAPGDLGYGAVYVRDRWSETTERVSVSSTGAVAEGVSSEPSISADGRYVAFVSNAFNLVPGDDWNGIPDVFVRDRQNGTTECVSVVPNSAQSVFFVTASISANGRYVAFSTFADNILPGVGGNQPTVYVRDRQTGAIELVSVDMAGQRAIGASYGPSISEDGRYVAFMSEADSLVPGDTFPFIDVFVRDRLTGSTERVNAWNGAEPNYHGVTASISADGRYVAFISNATNLVPNDTNQAPDAFVSDRVSGDLERVSVDSADLQGNSMTWGHVTSISADGRFVVFPSFSDNLVPGDTNGDWDVFLHDRAHPETLSLCDPGVSGVIACPCGNPPSGSYRGCDNSASTGGANLRITGGEYLSSDSLVLTTTGQTSTGLSLVVQGTLAEPHGVVAGQGVLCVGGSIELLYTEMARAGGITVPNLLAGDPPVHARSATLGDPIAAGSTRWYAVLYRDPVAPSVCPASSRFNVTQTRAVRWLP